MAARKIIGRAPVIQVDFSPMVDVCKSKRYFHDEDSAKEGGQGSRALTPLWVYHCVVCDGWHLTSIRQAERYRVETNTDYGDAEHEEDGLFEHLHHYGWGKD